MKKILSIAVVLLAFCVSVANEKNVLVVVGDSLTEGYGVSRENAYPHLLEKIFEKNHQDWKVVNSGIGGSTSASAPGRVKWVLRSNPKIVILFLGANDALRGIPPAETKKNLNAAVRLLQKAKVKVLLVEMQAPPNYGAEYTNSFKQVFLRVKKENKIDSLEFPLVRVAGKKEFNQADGIHPNEKGHEIIAEDIYKSVKGYL